MEESGARPGDSIAVIGAGPIGLMFIHAAELSGLRVIAVVKRPEQVESARLFGAQEVVKTVGSRDVIEMVRGFTDERRGVDIAIDAAATPTTWQWAVDMVRKGGTVNFFGGCAAGTQGFARYQPAALQRHHVEVELPPYSGCLPQRLSDHRQRPFQVQRVHHRAGAADGVEWRLSQVDGPLERYQDRDHSLN